MSTIALSPPTVVSPSSATQALLRRDRSPEQVAGWLRRHRLLEAIGYPYTEEQALATKIGNRSDTLAAVAKRLGDAGVNIDYAYLGAEAGSRQQLVLLIGVRS